MSNNYVPDLTQLNPGDVARSSDVNSRWEYVVSAFDLLPDHDGAGTGFSVPVVVGSPVLGTHATTRTFVETAMTSQVVQAQTYATNASVSASSASTYATNAENSSIAASGHASSASSSASSASTSASNALTYSNAASVSAGNALASASAASVSEGNASASQSAASTSASNAANSATLALTYANDASTSWDLFDDTYLGAKSSDPTVDNDGDALQSGVLYYDTVNSKMRVYNGAAFQDVAPVATSITVSQVSDLTATATELNHVGGVTSAIQTQLDNKQPSSAVLTDISDAGASTVADQFLVSTGAGTVAWESASNAAHSLIDGISLTAATVASDDKVLIQDTDGSSVLKTVTAGAIANLFSGGSDQTVSRINLKDVGYIHYPIGSIGGGTQSIDLTLGNVQSGTVDTSSTTFTFDNPTASDEYCEFVLILTNPGSQTIVWPAGVKWQGGVEPSWTVSGVDIIHFATISGGTTWYAKPISLDSQ